MTCMCLWKGNTLPRPCQVNTNKFVTNYTELSLWKANSHSAGQEIPSLSGNLNDHYFPNKSTTIHNYTVYTYNFCPWFMFTYMCWFCFWTVSKKILWAIRTMSLIWKCIDDMRVECSAVTNKGDWHLKFPWHVPIWHHIIKNLWTTSSQCKIQTCSTHSYKNNFLNVCMYIYTYLESGTSVYVNWYSMMLAHSASRWPTGRNSTLSSQTRFQCFTLRWMCMSHLHTDLLETSTRADMWR
jgi:hypothetical protein